MAGFILCRSKYSDRPYHISNMSISIFSMEELCYFIYNNIYLIGTDIFDEGLISYIGNELEEKELARQLEFLISQSAGLTELVITVLRYVDYYSEEEIEKLRGVIDRLDTQNVSERLKARADNFLNNRRYESAVHNYQTILYNKLDDTLTDEFYGSVWHNLGVAYAEMFSYNKALECFEKAYEKNKLEESLNAIRAASCLIGTADEENEEVYAVSREIQTMKENSGYGVESDNSVIRKALEYKEAGNTTEYFGELVKLVENWKMEYRNYIK